MVNYRYIGQWIRSKSGCGGCGTLRTTETLNTSAIASIVIGTRSFIANPGVVYPFTQDEAFQIEQWNNDKVYSWQLVP